MTGKRAVAGAGFRAVFSGHLITPKQKTGKIKKHDNATDEKLFFAQKRLGVIGVWRGGRSGLAGGCRAVPGRSGGRRAVVGRSSGGRRAVVGRSPGGRAGGGSPSGGSGFGAGFGAVGWSSVAAVHGGGAGSIFDIWG